jgi:predicted amidohydrolase
MKYFISLLALSSLLCSGAYAAFGKGDRNCEAALLSKADAAALAREAAKPAELKVSAVQYPVEGDMTVENFIAKVKGYVEKASASGSNLVVFPELIGLDLLKSNNPVSDLDQMAQIAKDVTPLFFDEIQSLSRQHGVSILAGTMPRMVEGGKISNTAYLAFPDGRHVIQDKLFMTPDEQHWSWKPGEKLHVFQAPWGRTVILTCYDSEFPITTQAIADARPEVILIPSMTDTDRGFFRVRWSAQALAVHHYAYVIHTGTVTSDANRNGDKYVGQASFLTPQDRLFPGVHTEGNKNTDGIINGTLDLKELREGRLNAGIYPARDQALRTAPLKVVEDNP